jgi:RHS repeat-associated protein
VAFTRDKAGRPTQRKYSDGTTINTVYDPMGLVTSADGVTIQRDTMGHPVNVNGMAVTYTPAGRVASITYATGKTVGYAYDFAGRLSSVADWVGGQTKYTYDASGHLIGLLYPNGVATTYSYDANGRLSGIATGSLASIGLTRDGDGKLVSADRNLPTAPSMQTSSQQFSYNAAAQMNGEKFDAMGRALTQNGRTYTWNLASQLTSFKDGAATVALTYDGLGELSSSNASGAAQTFVFNHAATLPALSIVRQGGNDLRYYVYTPVGQLLYSIEAADNTRKFYHFDEMGNTTFLTGDNGAVTDTYAVTPYGEIADHVGPTNNPFTWQGQYGIMQESKGLYFVRQRHYDAVAARFLSPDPLITPDPRSAEPYTYARGNPLLYVDPSGAISWAEISQFEIDFNGVGNQVPGYLTGVIINTEGWFNPDAFVMAALIWGCPGCTWDQLHSFANGANVATTAVTRTNANALSACLKLKTCLDSDRSVQLTKLVATGFGGYPEVAAASIVAQGGGNLVSHDGGSIVAQGGGNVISNDGGTLISQDGMSIITHDGGSIVAQGGGNIVAQGGGNFGRIGQ